MLQSIGSYGSITQSKFESSVNIRGEARGLGANIRNDAMNGIINSNRDSQKTSQAGLANKNAAASSNKNMDPTNTDASTGISNEYSFAYPPLSLSQKRDGGFLQFERDIEDYFYKIHKGSAKFNPDDLKEWFDKGFEIYKQSAIDAGLTDGNNEEYDSRIIEGILNTMRAANLNSADAAQKIEGQGRTGDEKVKYFHAEYWYKEREMFDKILSTGQAFAEKHNLPDPTSRERFQNSDFFKINGLGALSNEFELPEGFIPDRDFYIQNATNADYLEICGKSVRMLDIINMTSMEELFEYLADRRINIEILKMATKSLSGMDSFFIDKEFQETFDKKLQEIKAKRANSRETQAELAYEAYLRIEQKTSYYLA